MSHSHSHHHDSVEENSRSMKILLYSSLITFAFMLVEFFGGIFSKSLALISDSGHMLSDSFSLFLSLGAVYISSKKPDISKTFGYKRLETISAFVNGILLVLIALFIIKEAFERFFYPTEILVTPMLIISSIGLVINIISGVLLFTGAKDNINIKSAFLHVMSDLLGSLGAIAAALIIKFTGFTYADPVISIFISVLILNSSVEILKESMNILMEATPKGLIFEHVVKDMLAVEGVNDVHDLHIWSLTPNKTLLTAHVVIETNNNSANIIEKIKDILHDNFHIQHSTLEIETVKCTTDCCN